MVANKAGMHVYSHKEATYNMNKNILEFVKFAIGSVAERLQKSPAEVYRLFKQAGIIDMYLIPAYDVLHTFSRQYLTDDLLDYMKERGLKLC